MFNPAYVNEQP